MHEARYLRPLLDWVGEVAVYDLEIPLEGYRYVVVSALSEGLPKPETFIFGADGPEGLVNDWRELPGSLQGDMDHAAALARAGYVLVQDVPEKDDVPL